MANNQLAVDCTELEMASLHLFFLVVMALCSRGVLMQGCTPSPIWLFSDPEDINSFFQLAEGGFGLCVGVAL